MNKRLLPVLSGLPGEIVPDQRGWIEGVWARACSFNTVAQLRVVTPLPSKRLTASARGLLSIPSGHQTYAARAPIASASGFHCRFASGISNFRSAGFIRNVTRSRDGLFATLPSGFSSTVPESSAALRTITLAERPSRLESACSMSAADLAGVVRGELQTILPLLSR